MVASIIPSSKRTTSHPKHMLLFGRVLGGNETIAEPKKPRWT
jgi:hypothetical protein